MIAVRFPSACWVAAGLAVATCIAVEREAERLDAERDGIDAIRVKATRERGTNCSEPRPGTRHPSLDRLYGEMVDRLLELRSVPGTHVRERVLVQLMRELREVAQQHEELQLRRESTELLQFERELHDIDRRVKSLIEHHNMTRELFDEDPRRQRELERNDMLLRPPANASTSG